LYQNQFQRVNPLTKLLLLMLLTTLVFIVRSPVFLGFLTGYVLIVMGVSRTRIGMMRWLFIPFLISVPMTTCVFVGSYWSELGSLKLGFIRGLTEGGLFFLRIFLLLLANIIFVRTTDIRQFAVSLTRIKIPQVFVTLITTTFRFFPMMIQEGRRIIEVQRSRGIGPRHLLRPHHFLPIVIPLLLINMQRAHDMVLSMKLRGMALQATSRSVPFSSLDLWVLTAHASLGGIFFLFSCT
jgi:energy-coupling factor transport system permease protein